ncbi:MAG: hypothetical protein MHPSP_001614, partial [Paramarteilia canceri]
CKTCTEKATMESQYSPEIYIEYFSTPFASFIAPRLEEFLKKSYSQFSKSTINHEN